MARELLVRVVADPSAFTAGLKKAERSSKQFGRDMSHITRGALAATVSFRGLGRSIAFASGGFIAAHTAAEFITESINAAREAAVAQRSLAAQMKASGESFKANRDQIEKVALSYGKFGFQNDEVIQSLTVLERGTGNITQSIRLQGLTADLARAKNLDLANAATVVAKVFGGQETALRRAVPGLEKNAHGWDLLRQAQQKLGGQAAANTTASERFAAILHDTEEIVGTALLPILNKYLTSLGEWLQKMNESGKLQRDVESAMHAFTTAVNLAKGALDAMNKITGSTAGTVKLLLSAFVAYKTAKVAASIAGIAGQLGLVGSKAAKAEGNVRGLQGRLATLAASRYTVTITLAVIGGELLQRFIKWSSKGLPGQPGGGGTKFDPGDPRTWPLENLAAFAAQHGRGTYDYYLKHPAEALRVAMANRKQQQAALAGRGFTTGTGGGRRQPNLFGGAGVPTLPPAGLAALTPMQRAQFSLAAAGRTKTTADDLKALATEREILARQIAFISKRLASSSGKTAQNLAKTLKGLYEADAAAFDQITSITDAAAKDTDTAKKKHRTAVDKRNSALTQYLKDISRGVKLGVGDAGTRLTIGGVNAAIAAKEQAAQFRALGLTATGQQRAKSVRWLRRRAAQVAKKIAGTSADTPGNRAKLARVHLVLSGAFGEVGPQVSQEIQQELDSIAGEVSTSSDTMPISRFRHLSPSRVAAALGLQGNAAAASILSRYGAGGSLPRHSTQLGGGVVVVHNAHFHGVQNVKQLQNEMQKLQRGRPTGRRGAK